MALNRTSSSLDTLCDLGYEEYLDPLLQTPVPIKKTKQLSNQTRHHANIKVPKLILQPKSKAISILYALGFKTVRTIDVPTQTKPGLVLFVAPLAGKVVSDDQPIILFISKPVPPKKLRKPNPPPQQSPPQTSPRLFPHLPTWVYVQVALLIGWIYITRRIYSKADEADENNLIILYYSLPANQKDRQRIPPSDTVTP